MRLPAPSAVILSLAALAVAGCQRSPDRTSTPDASPSPQAAEGKNQPLADAPAEAAATADGVTVQQLDYAGIERLVASHRGRVVVMDAWSLACPPCIREFPKLVALQGRYPREQLACVSLSFDYDGLGEPADKLPVVEAFLRKQRATFDNVLATEESDVLYPKFHLFAVPAVFVYDKTGKLRHRFDNQQARTEAEMFTYEDVERLVVELLAETPESKSPGAASGDAEQTGPSAG